MGWAVTMVGHQSCADCMACVSRAIEHAKAMGTESATYKVESESGSRSHWAKVRRTS